MSNGILQETTPFVRRTNWFLGIGINNYHEFPKLYNAVKDVQDICNLLIEQYDFNEPNVITLFDEAANEENVISTLDQLSEKLEKEDTLLIYYSGHGQLTSKGLGFWLPYDAKRENTARYIPNSRIRDAIGAFDAQHVFLISDSCFSGSLLSQGATRSTRLIHELDDAPSRWALCSGRSDEEVDDGIPGTNSPFASSILNVLHSSKEDSINVTRLIDQVREQVAANSRQIPEGHPIQDVGHAWGEYIFRKKGTSLHLIQGGEINIDEPNSGKILTGELQQSEKPKTLDSPRKKRWKSLLKWPLIVVGTILLTLISLVFIYSHPPKLELTVDAEEVFIRPSGGTPWKGRKGYALSVKNTGGREVYSDFIEHTPEHWYSFSLFEEGTPGRYDVSIRDSLGSITSQAFYIPESYSPAIHVIAFHTTSEINENRWPVDQQRLFKLSNPVYAYANVQTDKRTNVAFVWPGTGHESINYVLNSTDPLRITDQFIPLEPGPHTIELIWINAGRTQVIRQATFQVNSQ